MPTFPRSNDILPEHIGWPTLPPGLDAWAASGKGQLRSTQQVGRTWTEIYGRLDVSKASVRSFFALVEKYWRERTILDVDHRSFRGMVGVGTGTPLVDGASQTGTSLVTDGWTASTTNIMRAGDVIRIAGLNLLYEITADVNSGIAPGAATLTISPAIYAGGSPANDAAITTNATPGSVLFRAVIDQGYEPPETGPGEFYEGLTIPFREVP